MSTMLKLQPSEQAELARCEAVIENGIAAFVDIGNALIEVKNKHLYREQFNSFDEYLITKWGIARSRGYQLMSAVKVIGNVSTIVDTSDLNESQVRPLTTLPPDQQAPALQAAKEAAASAGRKVTAKDVAKAAAEAKQKSAPVEPEPPQEPPAQPPQEPLETFVPNIEETTQLALLHDVLSIWERMNTKYQDEFLRKIGAGKI